MTVPPVTREDRYEHAPALRLRLRGEGFLDFRRLPPRFELFRLPRHLFADIVTNMLKKSPLLACLKTRRTST